MADYRVVFSIEKDDGRDGLFYRNGERWLREAGKEYRLKDIAPNLELHQELELMLGRVAKADIDAYEASITSNAPLTGATTNDKQNRNA